MHDIIQDTTWKSRYDMSDELTEIVKDAMTEITNGKFKIFCGQTIIISITN